MRDDRKQKIKFVDDAQRRKYMDNRLQFIKDCVKDYNNNLLPGESKMSIFGDGGATGKEVLK